MITDEAKIKIEELACYARTKGWDDEYTKAVNMAVKALEQQPCEDAVSRQAAINAAIDGADRWDGGFNCEREKCIREEIEKLPPVTPMPKMGSSSGNPNKWIPCSERLPEAGEYVGSVSKYYLVQNEYGDMLVARYTNSGYWEYIYHYTPCDDEIVAWMQLPEPLAEGSEE